MKRFKWKPLIVGVLIAAVLALASPIGLSTQDVSAPTLEIGRGQVSLVIGTKAYAAAVVDYTCDGVLDNIQFQQALDALPAAGGKITVLAGDYTFGAVVFRAINDITIEGVGRATNLTRDAVNPIFSAGTQSGWVFRDIRFDAGGITLAAATSYTLQNVAIGATYYGLSSAGDVLPTADSSYDLGSAGMRWRDLYLSGASLLLGTQDVTSDADSVDFPGGIDINSRALTDTGTQLQIDSHSIPRAVTLTVAASDSLASSMAQADYVCDGTDDQVQIQAAITALGVGGGTIQLSEGHFYISSAIVMAQAITLQGGNWLSTSLSIVNNADCNAIEDPVGVECWWVRIADLRIAGNKANNAAGHGVAIDDPTGTGSSFWTIERVSIVGMKNDGIYINFGFYRSIFQCDIESCDGWGINSGPNVENGTYIDHTLVQSNAGGSIRIQGGATHKVSFVVSEDGGSDTLQIGATYVEVTNCYFKSSDCGAGRLIYWSGAQGSFESNVIQSCANANWLLFLEADGNTIVNNRFYLNVVNAGANNNIISIVGQRNVIANNIIYNNTVEVCIMEAFATGPNVIANNVIYNNTGAIGIRGSRGVVSGNYVYNNTYGIYDTQATSTVIGNVVRNNVTADFYAVQGLFCKSFSDLFMDVLAVTANHVVNNEDLSAGVPITFTIVAQPDVPRTLSGHFDAHVNITAYTIVITGVNAKGNVVTETMTEADLWDWETDNAFATVTSIIMTVRTGTGAGDTMDIGITDVLGLSNTIWLTADVYKIKKNIANATVAAAQVNTTYDTYDFAVIGLAATDDFTIWFKSNLNALS